ncbi:NADPH:quinone oxidoreductase family protein [Micromonospora yasonensis]|uniref:NADPH:quinone oxidoreductase family protein n=1 Tax=Micromonospora yasonensis TaxID=1128667 RepID=UPI00222F53C2|nr:NADPH:quinone oxidoreductase family protein [Micromonospora yasonensis]MCW3841475.1 NADPH:quinone oxidoreductase family protein [Micromonospora yasonensis]
MLCRALGGPENLVEAEVPDPVAGPGQVVVNVRRAGVNFPDGLMVAGTYQTKPALPFSPGCEVAGTVRAVGDGVTGLAPGDRVAAFCGIGGYAEQVAVAAERVHRIPDGMDLDHAAAFPVVYGTSFHALVNRARLRADETLLVLGAAGGVGLTAVQIGKALGARVVAAASSPEKLRLCAAHGADELIDYREQDLAARLTEVTGGTGADVVYDPVGGPAAQAAVRALAWGGRYLTVGYASGDIPRVGMNRLLLTEGELLGVLWGAWAGRHPEANAANMSRLLEWYSVGLLRPHVDRQFPLAEAAAALAMVMNRGALGKIVLSIGERP